MMRIYTGAEAAAVLNRAASPEVAAAEERTRVVSEIIEGVITDGDRALRDLARRFGDRVPDSIRLREEEMREAVALVDEDARRVLSRSADNIRRFADQIVRGIRPISVEYPGYRAGVEYRPVERVGCYVPGGRFPLPSTALMTAVTARAAGVNRVVIACPNPSPEVIFAGMLAEVDAIYQVGGAQAIAALAFGTESIERVDMVVGPGNAWVTEAKRQLQGTVGIDMLAGPSEVVIIADAIADPETVALDLLAQAEHDPDARAWLLTADPDLAGRVSGQISRLRQAMAFPDHVDESLTAGGILILDSLEECAEASNRLAPEHLHIAIAETGQLRPLLRHYGALFIGVQATVPFGDYLAGPNHTLPTGRSARYSGSLSPLTFLRAQTWMEVTGDIDALAADTERFARLEGLHGHAAAARARRRET